MPVEVRLPALLRRHAGGRSVVTAQGRTLGELIEELERLHPGIKQSITAESGALHPFVNVYVNDEDIRYTGGTGSPLQDGDVVSILPAVAGGA